MVSRNLLKGNISFINRDDLILPECGFESVYIEVDKDVFHKNKDLIIGEIYRPPDKDLKLFNTNMEDLHANYKMKINTVT